MLQISENVLADYVAKNMFSHVCLEILYMIKICYLTPLEKLIIDFSLFL